MTNRSSGFEPKDPFLVDYKKKMEEVVRGMKSVGSSGFRLLMVEMIRSRWIRDKRTTYSFELAWVFDRKEDAVSKILKGLEEAGDVERVGVKLGKKDLARPYRPKTLKKTGSR